MDESLRAIAEPHRREILRLVRERELPAGEIAAHFDVSRPAISQHLRVLKDAGLVTERRQGTRRWYRAVPERVTAMQAFLETFWGQPAERRSQVPAPPEAPSEEGAPPRRWQRVRLNPQ